MMPQKSAPRNAPIKPTVARNPDCAAPRENSRAIGGSAAPNRAKSAASNMMPRNATTKNARCQVENGSRSSRESNSADLSGLAMVPPETALVAQSFKEGSSRPSIEETIFACSYIALDAGRLRSANRHNLARTAWLNPFPFIPPPGERYADHIHRRGDCPRATSISVNASCQPCARVTACAAGGARICFGAGRAEVERRSERTGRGAGQATGRARHPPQRPQGKARLSGRPHQQEGEGGRCRAQRHRRAACRGQSLACCSGRQRRDLAAWRKGTQERHRPQGGDRT